MRNVLKKPWLSRRWHRIAEELVAALQRPEIGDLKQHELVRRGAACLYETWHGVRVNDRHHQPWRAALWMRLSQLAIDTYCQAELDGHDPARRVAFAIWRLTALPPTHSR